MHTETRDLIDRLTNNVAQTALDERQLQRILRDADDMQRTEIAYYIEDCARAHPAFTATIDRIEEYIGEKVKVADWHVRHDSLIEEWADLKDTDISGLLLDEALDDLDNADTTGNP